MNRKGHVLIHVLITTIIVCVIATSLAQMLLIRYTASQRLASGVAGRKQDEGAFNVVLNTWNANQRTCYSTVPGFSCSGAGCGTGASAVNAATCACTVAPSPACTCPTGGVTNPGLCPGTMTATWTGGRCVIAVQSCQ